MGLKESGLRGSLRNVSTDIGIPDAVTDYWKMDEGSGSTLNNDVGSVDASLNGPSWDTDSEFGEVISFDGGDDHWLGDAELDGVNGDKVSHAIWFKTTDNDERQGIISTRDVDGSTTDNGWENNIWGDGGEYRPNHISSGPSNEIFGTISDVFNNDEWYLICLTSNGDDGAAYLYDLDGFVDSWSGSQSRGITDGLTVVGGNRGERDGYFKGFHAEAIMARGEDFGRDEYDKIWEFTRP